MIVVGPTGRRVLLPARAGRTYPGPRRGRHPPALRRLAARRRHRRRRRAGHGPGGRGARQATVELDDGRRLTADVVVGADGATSAIAAAAGLVDPGAVLWGFAQRGYVAQRRRPPDHRAVGRGARARVPRATAGCSPARRAPPTSAWASACEPTGSAASRAGDPLRRLLRPPPPARPPVRPVEGRRLGGWLKMGMVGTVAARGRTFLVGDAAGLVNPLQGEGIAPAMTSAAAAAEAILAGPGSAAARYRQHLAAGPGRYAVGGGADPRRGHHRVTPTGGAPRPRPHAARRRRRHRLPLGADLERPARRRASRPRLPGISPGPQRRTRRYRPNEHPTAPRLRLAARNNGELAPWRSRVTCDVPVEHSADRRPPRA